MCTMLITNERKECILGIDFVSSLNLNKKCGKIIKHLFYGSNTMVIPLTSIFRHLSIENKFSNLNIVFWVMDKKYKKMTTQIFSNMFIPKNYSMFDHLIGQFILKFHITKTSICHVKKLKLQHQKKSLT